jgi:hypothetical protein
MPEISVGAVLFLTEDMILKSSGSKYSSVNNVLWSSTLSMTSNINHKIKDA